MCLAYDVLIKLLALDEGLEVEFDEDELTMLHEGRAKATTKYGESNGTSN